MTEKHFNEKIEDVCQALKHISLSHENERYRDYHALYYEVLCGYIEAKRELLPLVENIVNQIELRLDWAKNRSEHDALVSIRNLLVSTLQNNNLISPIVQVTSNYQ